jgi:hypothetical protein
VAYGAALERRFTRKGIEGSNPSPSAMNKGSTKAEPLFMLRGLNPYRERGGFGRQSGAQKLASLVKRAEGSTTAVVRSPSLAPTANSNKQKIARKH